MDLRLFGKCAIVTGASRGIGYAIADVLAEEGADVALVARDASALDSAAERVARHGHRTLAVVADTSDDTAVEAMVSHVAGSFGRIDILVNAAARRAGPELMRPLADITDDDVRLEVETKVLGYLRCARAAAPYMVSRGWGRIINVGGLGAVQAVGVVASIRNVAVAAMAKNLADELGPAGITVTVVHPGMTVTEATPTVIAERAELEGMSVEEMEAIISSGISIGRIVTAAEVADVVAFLASPRSIAINGEGIAVGGGAPGEIRY